MNQSQKLKIVVILLAFFIFLAGMGFGYFISINTKTENTKIETKIEEISPTPTVFQFLQEDVARIKETEAEIELQERCGDFPDIKQLSTLSNSKTSASEAKWSPDCKYVLWFQAFFPMVGGWYEDNYEINKPKPTNTPTPFVAKNNEGIFLLNISSGKIERIYVPKKEEFIGNIKWIDNNQLLFSADESEFIYSIIDKKYVKNKNN